MDESFLRKPVASLLLWGKIVMAVGTLGRLTALAAVIVIAAAGLCLLDGDEVGGVELCAASVAVALTLPLAFPMPVTGRFLPALATIRPLYRPDLPVPPPKA